MRSVEEKRLEVEEALDFLTPTLFAIKIANICLETGNRDAFQPATAKLDSLWCSISSFQENFSKKFGAGEKLSDSEELQSIIADAMCELDYLEHCEVYFNVPLRQAVEQLEAANA